MELNGLDLVSSEHGGIEEDSVNPPTLLSVPHIPQVQSRHLAERISISNANQRQMRKKNIYAALSVKITTKRHYQKVQGCVLLLMQCV